jgi:uncharacterized lipoprotein YehR (DUF1307 family)
MKKALVIALLGMSVLLGGCGSSQLHKVDGVLVSKTYYDKSDNLLVVRDSYGKETVLKSNQSMIVHWAHVGDKVEVDYTDSYWIENIKVYK